MGKSEKTNQKSSAKAAGLKSVFTLSNDDLLLTSFGRGSEAKIEKAIHNDSVEDKSSGSPAFAIKKEGAKEEHYRITGRANNSGKTDNPLYRRFKGVDITTKEDVLHAKKVLEQRYYGKAFDDNIHIQAIYNVLDIEKILTVHVNNIIYTLNNFLRIDGDDYIDFVGSLLHKPYSEWKSEAKDTEQQKLFDRLCRARQLGYLDIGVIVPKTDEEKKRQQSKKREKKPTHMLSQEEFYYVLASLADLRNMLAHGAAGNSKNIYKMAANESQEYDKGVNQVLEKLYRKDIESLNNDFLDRSKNNLSILSQIFDISKQQGRQDLLNKYYNFEVKKEYKYLGFSIKKIRELFMADEGKASVLSSTRYDSVRSKVYRFLDFILYDYCLNNPLFVEQFVEKLRAAKDDEEKEKIYVKQADALWIHVDQKVQRLAELCNGKAFSKNDASVLDGISIKHLRISTNAAFFTKYVFMLACFIDGKEINDLLTKLINKFDNINSFQRVMSEYGISHPKMNDPYALFNHSEEISGELRIVNSIARMRKPSPSAKKIMYAEALQVLGISDDEDGWDLAEDILNKAVNGDDSGEKDSNIRNFVANNVIESNRFHYLARYGSPKKVRLLIQNRGLVRFVLKDIPDTQIERYYKNVVSRKVEDPAVMRNKIARVLHNFSFDNLKDVKQNDRSASPYEKREKERLKALVSLYLTVLYLIVKNLVYVNSRYYLAFHCVERDRLLLDPMKWKQYEANKYNPEYRWNAFAEWFLQNYPHKKRVMAYLQQNMEKSSDWAIQTFRNKIEHLDAVRNAELYLSDFPDDWEVRSWFEVYHYVIQRRIQTQYNRDTKTESRKFPGHMLKESGSDDQLLNTYYAMLDKYHTPVKDFIKELNTPFAYNLSRYKNLSIDDLFDQNRPGKNVSLYE